jgi:hypothetical protein
MEQAQKKKSKMEEMQPLEDTNRMRLDLIVPRKAQQEQSKEEDKPKYPKIDFDPTKEFAKNAAQAAAKREKDLLLEEQDRMKKKKP